MKKNIKINPKKTFIRLLYGIIVFSLIKPDSLEYIGLKWLDNLIVVFDGIVMAILMFNVLIRKIKISRMTKIVMIMYFFMFIPTIFISHDYLTFLKTAGPAFALCIFTDYNMEKNPMNYFKSITMMLLFIYTLNFITIIIYYPDGMYRMEKVVGDLYLMGYDNGMIYNFIPMVAYSLIYCYLKKGNIIGLSSIYAIFLTIASEFYVKSGTGMIQAVLLVLLIIMANNKLIKKILKPEILFSSFVILTVLVVFFRIQNYFSWFFVDILHKDLTFTGRTVLWDYVIPIIKKHFFIGTGASTTAVYGLYNRVYSHPHCLILDMLLKGGIWMLLSFFGLMVRFSQKFYENKEDKNVIKLILLVSIFVFLVGEIVNSVQYKVFFWALFVMIEYADKLVHDKMKGENN